MTKSPQAADYRATMRARSRTFYWASRLFGRRLAADIAQLYAFCRTLDDLADSVHAASPRTALERIRADLAAGSSSLPVVADFLLLARRHALPEAAVEALITALEQDLEPVRLSGWEQTLSYGYGVAGTVGVLFCAIVGVRDPEALPFAVDLGIAMQLTNMARDIQEDARLGRLYLPLPAAAGDARALAAGDPKARAAAVTMAREALLRAEAYYRSADLGMAYLPLRPRAAVLVAARSYEAIGAVIRRPGRDYWSGPARVSAAGKLWHSLRALAALGAGLVRPKPRPGVHDARLHAPLEGGGIGIDRRAR